MIQLFCLAEVRDRFRAVRLFALNYISWAYVGLLVSSLNRTFWYSFGRPLFAVKMKLFLFINPKPLICAICRFN